MKSCWKRNTTRLGVDTDRILSLGGGGGGGGGGTPKFGIDAKGVF